MALQQCISRLGGWEGYAVSADRSEYRRGQSWCVIMLAPVRGQPRCCSGCGQYTTAIHDLEQRRIRDLPLFEHRVELVLPRVRVACARCGPKLERLTWLDPYARVTRRLAESVARLCQVASVLHVARFFGLDWKTVKDLDRAYLQRTLGPVDLDGIEVIALDEFAIQKGHRYATVVVEPTRKRVLWVGRGRGREDVRPFFALLGPDRCCRLRAAVMDMNASYELEVRRHCPQAAIVFDLFHVVAKYGREVIDRVRVDRANELAADRPARRVVKGARWLLLKNRASLRPGEDVELEELLAANHALFIVYVLRDALKELWHYRHAGYAARAWRNWYRQAIRSRIQPLVQFARRLKPYLPGILAHCRWPLGTNLVEGINNKIKVIKRMAYGFRDDAYFFLKIRAAFPGVGR
ncbi:MAG TPA: ISL3 family transposase [Steroidobacteraceae bacterium]|nr:ISL3 family transposase [Steroidobacteraceae bacterium]